MPNRFLSGLLAYKLAPSPPREARMKLETASLEELGLLECLHTIDRGEIRDARSDALRDRLIEAGLVEQTAHGLALTPAGVERCRSLQHRVAADREAQKIIDARGESDNAASPVIVVASSVASELAEHSANMPSQASGHGNN